MKKLIHHHKLFQNILFINIIFINTFLLIKKGCISLCTKLLFHIVQKIILFHLENETLFFVTKILIILKQNMLHF